MPNSHDLGKFFEICILMMAGRRTGKIFKMLSLLIWKGEEILYVFRDLILNKMSQP